MRFVCYFFSSRRRHTRFDCDWSSDVCSSDLWTAGRRRRRDTRAGRQRARDCERGLGAWCLRALAVRHTKRGLESGGKRDRKSVVEGKSVDLGGRRIIKKKKIKTRKGVS